MLLRPRQKELVNRVLTALHEHGNTLAVAPTGAGKTIMLSAAIGVLCKASTAKTPGFKTHWFKTCVLAHRDELTVQNETKFCRVNPHLSTGIFDASSKSWQGDTTFAMVQTLSREANLATMPKLDLLVIDEAHHARADSYVRIVNHAQSLNPNLKLLGMTATPNRGDKKGLYPIFSNVCDQIMIGELIASGHLVRPRTFVMDVGVRSTLQEAKKTSGGEYDMDAISHIMDTLPINEAVVSHWKEKAKDRQTVVFCSTVKHARHVCREFVKADIAAVLVHGDMSDKEREDVLQAYTSGQAQVIVNVAVLTEGWDHPPTSCVVLLRPSSYQSTFIQMVGRGLRTVNEAEYPGFIKKDCIILDFGTATLAHGSLEQMVDLADGGIQPGYPPFKKCPACSGTVPSSVCECSLCGFEFTPFEKPLEATLEAQDFAMREVNLFEKSNFKWLQLGDKSLGGESYEQEEMFMASGFEAWGSVILKNDQWHAIGGIHKENARLLAVGDEAACVAAANDWMNLKESEDTAHKAKDWLSLPATPSQLHYLRGHDDDQNLTRYEASLLLVQQFNANKIDKILRQGEPR
jgi:DNA repair protein RadD